MSNNIYTKKLKKLTLVPIDNGWILQLTEGDFFPATVYFDEPGKALAQMMEEIAALTHKDQRGKFLSAKKAMEDVLNG